jgi:predicted PurR-regulated permease PerM
VLNEFSSQPSSIIITVSGAIWMFAGIFTLWSIWQKKAWTAKLLLGAAAGYTIWYWSERLIWQRPHPNWPFAVIVNLVLLGFILFTIKSLSREAYEQKNENPKSE